MSDPKTARPPSTAGTAAVRLDVPSLLLLPPLAATLGLTVFPALVPEMATGSYWWMAAAASLAYVFSILGRYCIIRMSVRVMKVPVESATLFLFGPVVVLPGDEIRPAEEAILAAVHLTTLFVFTAGFLWIFASAFGDRPPLLALGPAFFLAIAHAGLIGFYLLPGYPLDGGRFLRAALGRWKPQSSRAIKAPRWAGTVLAVVFVFGGAGLGLTGALVAGLWLMAGGALLYRATTTCRRKPGASLPARR
jgi:Zn-dependent protease